MSVDNCNLFLRTLVRGSSLEKCVVYCSKSRAFNEAIRRLAYKWLHSLVKLVLKAGLKSYLASIVCSYRNIENSQMTVRPKKIKRDFMISVPRKNYKVSNASHHDIQ